MLSNRIYNLLTAAGIFCALSLLSCASASGDAEPVINRLEPPEGFEMHAFAENVEGARSMVMSPNGVLYVGTRGQGKVYALIDEDNDYRADRRVIIAEDLRMPNGVAWRDGSLYVAEVSRILRFEDIDSRLDNPPAPVVIRDDYPADGHHGWKYIAFGPDDKLYVPVGAPCNICESEDEIYAAISRISPDGTDREIVAHGVRNTVGFAWHPETGDLWFTDNGRDMLGDNRPPDELNRLTETGQHFGYPYVHGQDIEDPDFGEKGKQINRDFIPPMQELGAHVASLGMLFYTGDMFPAEYQNQIFIAEHGSWNRSDKTGYRITLVRLENGKAASYDPFITGWLQDNGAVWGRPVDLLQLGDGSLLISDDLRGVIYRLTYTK